MVLVDIYVPAIDQTFDFNLNEGALTASVLEEVGEMIAQMTQNGSEKLAEVGKLVMCNMDNKMILPENMSLSQCGIHNGTRLLVC